MPILKTPKMSIYDYFNLIGIQDAERIEVTYKDGSKVALEGYPAVIWWRGVHIREGESDRRDEEISATKFRSVNPDGTLIPRTLEEMLMAHVWSTGCCSFMGHVRSSSVTYSQIIAFGMKAVPEILEFMKNGHRGMNVMLLLWDITKETPYQPEQSGGFAKFNVKECSEAWLDWGRKKGFTK